MFRDLPGNSVVKNSPASAGDAKDVCFIPGLGGSPGKSESVSCCVMSDSLCDSMDCSPPVSSVHGILQARMLEWE